MMNSSSYIDITEAEEYFATRLNANSWNDATDVEKNSALITATRAIDRLAFSGDKTDPAQALEFPRNADTEIPDDIKIATCELAFQLLDGVDPNLESEILNTTSDGYSTVKESFDRGFVQNHIRAGIPSIEAWNHLTPYLADTYSISLKRV